MRKGLKIVSASMVLVLSLGIFAGCSQGKKEQNPASNVEKKESKTLDFIWFSDGVEGNVTKNIMKDYQEKNPNIQFDMIEVPYKDLETKLKVMVSGGEPPTMARLTNVSMFKDSLQDLTQYLGDTQKFLGQFTESVAGYYQIDGKILALPTDVTANGLIYNKTAFKKAGVEVPTSPDKVWTWDEWVDAMKKVMEKGGVRYGLVVDKTAHRWSTLLYEAGGSMMNDDATKVTINSKEGVEAVEFLVKLHKEKIIPDSVWVGSENPNNLFRTGQVAMHLSGSWMMTNYRDNVKDFEWGVTYLPKGKIRSSVPGGKFVGVFQKNKAVQEGVDFLKYFTSKEVNAKYCSESLFLSPRKDNADLPFAFGKEYFKIFAEELAATPAKAGRDWSHPKLATAISSDVRDGIAEVIAGKTTAKEMLDKMAKKGQEALDKK